MCTNEKLFDQLKLWLDTNNMHNASIQRLSQLRGFQLLFRTGSQSGPILIMMVLLVYD